MLFLIIAMLVILCIIIFIMYRIFYKGVFYKRGFFKGFDLSFDYFFQNDNSGKSKNTFFYKMSLDEVYGMLENFSTIGNVYTSKKYKKSPLPEKEMNKLRERVAEFLELGYDEQLTII